MFHMHCQKNKLIVTIGYTANEAISSYSNIHYLVNTLAESLLLLRLFEVPLSLFRLNLTI